MRPRSYIRDFMRALVDVARDDSAQCECQTHMPHAKVSSPSTQLPFSISLSIHAALSSFSLQSSPLLLSPANAENRGLCVYVLYNSVIYYVHTA